MPSSAARLVTKVRRGVQNIAYGNPVYQKILDAGAAVDAIHFAPPDLWPGNAEAGMTLLATQGTMFGAPAPSGDLTKDLRNLRAVGSDVARQAAARRVITALDNCENWSETGWAQDVIGARIASLIGFYEFYAPAMPIALRQRLAASLQRQWKHLLRTIEAAAGLANLEAVRGLILGGFNFPEGEKGLGLACDLLVRQLDAEIMADGAHISRNPQMQLRILCHLIELRAAFRAAQLAFPDAAVHVIPAMVPVLKFYRHVDGALTLFHGAAEETPLLLEAAIIQSEARGRTPRRLPQGAYERIAAGRSLLIADCGAPPVSGHAGLLAFEFGQGKERLIVNCGNCEKGNLEWRAALAATAAHSTLTLNDLNAAEIFTSDNLRFGGECTAQRYEQNGSQIIDMTHDGYRARCGITHRRILELSGDGDELRGRDVLEGQPGQNFTLRWHLHPALQVSLSHGGGTALLRTPSGAGWRLRLIAGHLNLEPSIYCGSGAPRRSMQIKTSGNTQGAETAVIWTLAREKK